MSRVQKENPPTWQYFLRRALISVWIKPTKRCNFYKFLRVIFSSLSPKTLPSSRAQDMNGAHRVEQQQRWTDSRLSPINRYRYDRQHLKTKAFISGVINFQNNDCAIQKTKKTQVQLRCLVTRLKFWGVRGWKAHVVQSLEVWTWGIWGISSSCLLPSLAGDGGGCWHTCPPFLISMNESSEINITITDITALFKKNHTFYSFLVLN